MNKPKSEDEIAFRQIGTMTRLLGLMIETTKAGNVEEDFHYWLRACWANGVTTEPDKLRIWYRLAMSGIGLVLPDDRPQCNYSSLKAIEREWLEG